MFSLTMSGIGQNSAHSTRVVGSRGRAACKVASRGKENSGSVISQPAFRDQQRPRGMPRVRGLATVGGGAQPRADGSCQQGQLPEALLKSARNTGHLNLSGRALTTVPERVWRVNEVGDEEARRLTMEMDGSGEDRWWEQKPLTKLLLSSNQLTELSEDVQLLSQLKTLELQDNRLSDLPVSWSPLQQLTRLVLSHNQLSQLPEQLFSLSSLQLLLLTHNRIEQLPEALGQLLLLEQLDVSHNQLREVPASIGYLHRLNRLNLSHNQIKSLPADIGCLTSVRHLDVSYNQLTSLPDSVSELYQLQVLDLRRNQLSHLPSLSSCSGLKELHLGENRIQALDDGWCKGLTSLAILDISNNKIPLLPKSMAMLKNLERLNAANNDISGVPLFLGCMTNIKSLQLEGNPMRSLRKDLLLRGTKELLRYFRERAGVDESGNRVSDDVSNHTEGAKSAVLTLSFSENRSRQVHQMRTSREMKCSGQKLESLDEETVRMAAEAHVLSVDASHNSLATVPNMLCEHLSSHLSQLNFSHNRLASVTPALSSCHALSYLNLSNNRLCALPDQLASLTCLREVCLTVNRFTEVPPVLYRVSSLEILMLANNAITTLDVDNLARLTRLTTLDVSNNSIGHVPPKLGFIQHLQNLRLSGNPFKQPRASVLNQGTDAVLQYLRDRVPLDQHPVSQHS